MTRELEKIIIESPTESKIIEESRRQGMLTMRQDGFLKVLEGIVSLEEVLGAVEEAQ
jgi:type II secretory ATPase GspE/PulE/Tfp pilus assembly ATPase PilB-like protein